MSSLYSAEKTKEYQILEMPNIPLLHTLGLFQGAIVKKITTYSFGGPVLLMVDSREVAVGKNFATKIMVEQAVHS